MVFKPSGQPINTPKWYGKEQVIGWGKLGHFFKAQVFPPNLSSHQVPPPSVVVGTGDCPWKGGWKNRAGWYHEVRSTPLRGLSHKQHGKTGAHPPKCIPKRYPFHAFLAALPI